MKTRKTILILCAGLLTAWQASAQPYVEEAEKPLRNFQLSILPAVGTEGMATQSYRYRASLNIFAGITGGIEGFEAGGLLNITHGRMSGIQLAGFGNLVRGDVTGFQGAGFFNVNSGHTHSFRGAGFVNFSAGHAAGFAGSGFLNISGGSALGFQGAGFANITGGNSQGFVGSGFANITGAHAQGFLAAGFANITGANIQGFAASGFANITGANAQGFLAAGFANITGGHAHGFQAAGFANLAKGDVSGPQFAGFMNTAQNLKGMQVSGFLNIARSLHGLQLSVVNIADTVSQGVPVGFLSIVKKGGVKQLELAASDALHLNMSIRTGIPAFYNIFSYGIQAFSQHPARGFGYGIGSGLYHGEKMLAQVEAHTSWLHKSFSWHNDNLDLLNELRAIIGYKTNIKVELFAAAVLYSQVYANHPEGELAGHGITPEHVWYERSWNNHYWNIWAGVRGGIRMNL